MQPYYVAVSSTKLVVMSLCTFSLYELYWFYENWVLVCKDSEYGKGSRPKEIAARWSARCRMDRSHPAMEASGSVLACLVPFGSLLLAGPGLS